MTGKEAVIKLRALDYSIALRDDDRIEYRYRKGENPPPEAPSLLEVLRRNKHVAVSFLGQENIQKKMIYEQALEEVNRNYAPGTIDFLKQRETGLWKKIVEEEAGINETLLTGGTEELKEHVEKWLALYLKAIGIFREQELLPRPDVSVSERIA